MRSVHRLLRDLVAIDSVNPSLVPGAAGEGADRARRSPSTCARIGLDVEMQEVGAGAAERDRRARGRASRAAR